MLLRVLFPSWRASLLDKSVWFQGAHDLAKAQSQNGRRLPEEGPWPWCVSSGGQSLVCVATKGRGWKLSRDACSANTARRARLGARLGRLGRAPVQDRVGARATKSSALRLLICRWVCIV